MEQVSNDYLGKHKKFRTDSKKLATVFLVSAFIVALIVFWWLKLVGITVTGEAFCGLEEHTHGADCYVSELVCGLEEVTAEAAEESDETTTDIASGVSSAEKEPTTVEAHLHTDECYSETLTCTLQEHTHDADCFPDKTADVETVSDWLYTFEDVEITNDIPENLVAIAMSQLGYEESDNNFEYDEDGNRNGYTRYGEWYGNPYGKWNTMFVSFCLHYSNINNDSELKASGAEALRLAWRDRGVYSSSESYSPARGDIVFFDDDGDGTADSSGIVIAYSEGSLAVIMGDSSNSVESLSLDISDSIIGYGMTGELSFARDTEYGESTDSQEEAEGSTAAQQVSVNAALLMMFSSGATTVENPSITYINELDSVVRSVRIETHDGVEITNDSTVYVGQSYVISIRFSEDNEGTEWIQFKHDEDHHLYYSIPENLQCESFDWQPIFAETENGTIEDVGKYKVNDEGRLIVVFEDDPQTGECFGSKYSNVDFTIHFDATIASTGSGSTTDIVFNDDIKVNLNIDGKAGIDMTKNHGEYDPDNHTMEYTVRVEATYGLIKDYTFEDYTWNTHKVLKDTVVVTDLKGNLLDPQPVVGDEFTTSYSGFSLVGLPDFSAGEGYLITYKTKVDDDMILNDSVSLGNGAYGAGRDSNGDVVGSYKEDWVVVELEKMTKDGKQTVLKDENGNDVPVIEWEVAIKKNNSNLQGTVIIDTLGEGLKYYTDQPIIIKHYDEWGNSLVTQYLSWDQVTVENNKMSFPLPDGYSFDIFYYTTYELPDEGEQLQYNNSVSATINGKQEIAGGEADVVAFIPHIQKNAYGNDGQYVYFTIEAEVPGVIKDWGNFYLTDTSAFWGYQNNDKGYLYVENIPENIVITAVTESNRTITFTPYVAGGPIENTYILVTPADDREHTFKIYFNTSDASDASSKWILNEDSLLTITYKIPFDAATGTEWTGELSGDKTLEDVLLENYALANQATLNYSNVIKTDHTANYKYSPKIFKKSTVNKDGTIDYTVVFHNTVPGSNGNSGYLASADFAYFTDTFDERLEYVPGSLTVTCYNPWDSNTWLNSYSYNGEISGNTINVASSEFLFEKCNPYCGWDNPWLSTLDTYLKYCKNMGGGNHVFTYKLKVKDDYLYSTDTNKYKFDNTAEMLWGDDGSSGPVTDRAEFETGLVDKHVVQENNKLKFDIHVNENALDILKGIDTLTIEDTMTRNLSLYWDSIKLYYEDGTDNWVDFDSEGSRYKYTVAYDQASNKLTFTVPDELHIRIDYTTLITENGMVSVSNSVEISGKAQITDIINATFKVEDHSGGATGSMHEITLIKQDGDTDDRLPGVRFYLYGPMGDPSAVLPAGVNKTIYTASNEALQYIGTYVTGADGATPIKTQYLTQGGPYALVEVSAPEGYMKLDKPVYFYFYKPDPDGIIQTVTTLIAVENYTYGFVLPETGGAGIFPLAIIGISLMTFPVLYSTIRRKRERRLTKSP